MILFYLSTVNIEFPHSNYYTCARCNSMSKTDTTLARKEIESQTKPRNCAWLIKGVVKREIIQMAERDDELKVVFDGTGSVYDNIGWYLVSISWYCLFLGGTGSAKGLHACIYWKKKWRFDRVLPITDTQTERPQNIELLILSTG